MGYEECDKDAHRDRYVFADWIIVCLMFPIHMIFVCYFCYKLWINRESSRKNPLIFGIISYIICSVLVIGVYFIVIFGTPLIQTFLKMDLIYCQTMEMTARFVGSTGYLCMIEVFLLRLDLAFKQTAYELSRITKYCFRTVMWGNYFVANTGAAARVVFFHCWQAFNNGPLGRLPYYQRTSYWCEGKERPIFSLSMTIAGYIIALLNVTLLWMFISRLRELSADDFDSLIEKSSVVSIAGSLSSLVAFTVLGFTGNLTVIVFDVSFNCLLLFTLFEFANDTYQFLFGRMVAWFRVHWLQSESDGSASRSSSSSSGSRGSMNHHRLVSDMDQRVSLLE